MPIRHHSPIFQHSNNKYTLQLSKTKGIHINLLPQQSNDRKKNSQKSFEVRIFFGKTDIFGAIHSKVLSMIFSPKKIGEGGLSRKFGSLTGTVASRWLARFKLMPAGMKSQNVLTATLLNEFFPLAMGPLL